jgi:hypothetical protein
MNSTQEQMEIRNSALHFAFQLIHSADIAGRPRFGTDDVLDIAAKFEQYLLAGTRASADVNFDEQPIADWVAAKYLGDHDDGTE